MKLKFDVLKNDFIFFLTNIKRVDTTIVSGFQKDLISDLVYTNKYKIQNLD